MIVSDGWLFAVVGLDCKLWLKAEMKTLNYCLHAWFWKWKRAWADIECILKARIWNFSRFKQQYSTLAVIYLFSQSKMKWQKWSAKRGNKGEARGRLERNTAGERQGRANVYLGHSEGRISCESLAGRDNSPLRRRAGNVLIGSFGKWSLQRDYCWPLIEMGR